MVNIESGLPWLKEIWIFSCCFMNTFSHKNLIVIKFYSSKCLHTYFISLDASVTFTENKSAEQITENERAESYPLEKMLPHLRNQNIDQSKSAKK